MTLARRHLPPEVAERWIGLIRPGVRLRTCRRGQQQVGQLGGLPCLPDDVDWPQWPGEGSLNFVASIDCGRLPADGFDIPLPDSGTLLFFYFDPDSGYFDPKFPPRTVGVWDPQSLAAGSSIIYVPADTPVIERVTPSDIDPYDLVPLTATPTRTGIDWSHPAFEAACRGLSDADRAFLDDYGNRDEFVNATHMLTPSPKHQVGGHAEPVQDAVEMDVAGAQLVVRAAIDDATSNALPDEARRWTLVAQIDSDDEAGMMWGDVGRLYWLMRPEDLAARNFDASSFTWQCT